VANSRCSDLSGYRKSAKTRLHFIQTGSAIEGVVAAYTIFEAGYEEHSLSKAAARLAMTQPAMSHALSQLREVFRDELFIRNSCAE
jgi:hypothetical protein